MITQNFSYLKYQKYSEIWDILAHGVRSEKVNNYSDMLFCYHCMFLNHFQFSKERSNSIVHQYLQKSKSLKLHFCIFVCIFSKETPK